jgi:hypothetical protein
VGGFIGGSSSILKTFIIGGAGKVLLDIDDAEESPIENAKRSIEFVDDIITSLRTKKRILEH